VFALQACLVGWTSIPISINWLMWPGVSDSVSLVLARSAAAAAGASSAAAAASAAGDAAAAAAAAASSVRLLHARVIVHVAS
jgi:hypothetical protein